MRRSLTSPRQAKRCVPGWQRRRRRKRRLVRPGLALDDLHRVPGRVADIDRAATRVPDPFPLDLDAARAEGRLEPNQLTRSRRKGHMAWSLCAVRGNIAANRGGALAIKQEQYASVFESERC